MLLFICFAERAGNRYSGIEALNKLTERYRKAGNLCNFVLITACCKKMSVP